MASSLDGRAQAGVHVAAQRRPCTHAAAAARAIEGARRAKAAALLLHGRGSRSAARPASAWAALALASSTYHPERRLAERRGSGEARLWARAADDGLPPCRPSGIALWLDGVKAANIERKHEHPPEPAGSDALLARPRANEERERPRLRIHAAREPCKSDLGTAIGEEAAEAAAEGEARAEAAAAAAVEPWRHPARSTPVAHCRAPPAYGSRPRAASASSVLARASPSAAGTGDEACRAPQRRAAHAPILSSPAIHTGAVINDLLRGSGYVSKSPIAAGSFSTVVRARHVDSGRDVAVKSYQLRSRGGRTVHPSQIEAMDAEISALHALAPSAHPHIANMVELFETKHGRHVVLQYCAGCSLARHLASLRAHGLHMAEGCAAAVGAQVGGALAHMHRLGVVHRDVKPDNIVYEDSTKGSVRLVDFGFATARGTQGQLRTHCGTPCYMAPELVRKVPYRGPPIDVWALGCLVYELLHNRPAFRAETMSQLHTRILRASLEAFRPAASPRARSAVRRMLAVDAAERPSAERATERLRAGFGPPPAQPAPVVQPSPLAKLPSLPTEFPVGAGTGDAGEHRPAPEAEAEERPVACI